MDDIYKINQYHLNLGNKDNLNEKQLVSKKSIEQVLEKELNFNKEIKKEWIKMTKTQKLKKLKLFSQEYVEDNEELSTKNTSEKEVIQYLCWQFLRDALDKKRINNKDIEYNIDDDKIINIKSLVYNSDLNKFALRRSKSSSSVENLPSFKLKQSSKNLEK